MAPEARGWSSPLLHGDVDDQIDSMVFGLALDPGTISSGMANFTVDLRGQVYDSVRGGFIPSSTLYASDSVSISVPTSISSITEFSVTLTSTDLPNIGSYSIPAASNMSLVIYQATTGLLSIQRTTSSGVAASVTTSNGYSDVTFISNGFVYDPSTRSMAWSFGRAF